MAHIVFVSLYDEHCHGQRMLVAELKAAGHRADVICVKQYTQVPIAQAKEVWDECHVQVLPDGDYVNSYSYPITDKERDLLVELIDRLNPNMVGFGCTVTQQRRAAEMAALVRQRCKKPILFGGPFPTTMPEWALKHADYVCRGEADDAIIDIANALDRGGDIGAIPNVCHLDAQGKLVEVQQRPLIADLDRLPFPDHSTNNYYIDHDTVRQETPFPESELNNTYLTMTARGCPHHCSYCYNSFMQTLYGGQAKVRERSIPRVIEELKQAKARRGGHFYLEILDSIFTLKPERVREFCEAYHREINLPFWCYTHPRYALEETIKPLAECPNCEYIIMGIQSVSHEIGIKMFHRVQTTEDILNASQVLHKSGLKVFYDIITNVPGETESMCRANLDLLRQLPKPWRLRLSKISLFPEFQIRKDTGESHCVTSKRYRLWNALYFMAQDVELTDAEIDAILADPVLEAHPEILEKTNGAFEERFRDLDDTRSRLKVERALHGATREAMGRAYEELADIRYRKGFRHFMRVSDLIQGKGAGRLRAQQEAAKACDGAAQPALAEGEYHKSVLAMARPSQKNV